MIQKRNWSQRHSLATEVVHIFYKNSNYQILQRRECPLGLEIIKVKKGIKNGK